MKETKELFNNLIVKKERLTLTECKLDMTVYNDI